MTYRVTIYCADRHIVYDGRTPRGKGVGGGITARIRMAHALQRRGDLVTLVVNCPRRESYEGVEYVPLDEATSLVSDILILTTSGDRLDLAPAQALSREAQLTIVWVHGPTKPGGMDDLGWDSCYAVSNFIADVVRDQWGIPSERIFVSYNAFDEALFAGAEAQGLSRDPYRLVYFSHPSKGLETAVAVFERLRARDSRFTLRVLGSEALWGGEGTVPDLPEGASFGGLVGQADVAGEMVQAGFSLQMQAREEPGALAIMEGFRAGCIIVASPVGCYPEMIDDGRNGLMIQGDHADSAVRDDAAKRILELINDPSAVDAMRREATAAPWSSDRMAEVWEGHWDWLLGRGGTDGSSEPCCVCSGPTLSLADGLHCLECSSYRARIPLPA
jgi:glycosyltransferase involved in cell wall biosynthesis